MNGALLQALSKGIIEKIVRLLRQLCVRYRLLAVFRHEAPAHVRWPCIVVDEAEGMYPIESSIGVARGRIVGLQEMKLRGLVGMLFHEGSQLAGIGFACLYVLGERQELVLDGVLAKNIGVLIIVMCCKAPLLS